MAISFIPPQAIRKKKDKKQKAKLFAIAGWVFRIFRGIGVGGKGQQAAAICLGRRS